MPKISDEEMEPIQIRLFKSDLTYLRSLYRSNIGVNRAVRSIIRSFIANHKATTAQAIDAQEATKDLIP